MNLPKKLQEKLQQRIENQSLRELPSQNDLVDFSSNDYLELSSDAIIFQQAHEYLLKNNIQQNGATGSRLISGNHKLYKEVEAFLCEFHESESALIFNSGYDANVGFFSSVPQRGDVILFDELSHASIRDGIRMSHAKSYKFKHNDLDDLKDQLERSRELSDTIYVVTESVFSMDGDTPDLKKMDQLTKEFNAHLILDEAHAVGVFGNQGVGISQTLEIHPFARILTFGKALGCHGAAILGSFDLILYLVNFARSFIYTTGLPPHSLATILMSYQAMINSNKTELLQQNIEFFQSEVVRLQLKNQFIPSDSAIHSYVISGIKNVKEISKHLQNQGFEAKAIVSPTVPNGQERIRFCLHAYNSHQEIADVLTALRIFTSK
jgi:8-amino-7-oxononanoate synthase